MYQVKLFKNGNSTVMAIPEEMRTHNNWKPGDTIQLNDLGFHIDPAIPIITAWKNPAIQKENPPHARKATRKTH